MALINCVWHAHLIVWLAVMAYHVWLARANVHWILWILHIGACVQVCTTQTIQYANRAHQNAPHALPTQYVHYVIINHNALYSPMAHVNAILNYIQSLTQRLVWPAITHVHHVHHTHTVPLAHHPHIGTCLPSNASVYHPTTMICLLSCASHATILVWHALMHRSAWHAMGACLWIGCSMQVVSTVPVGLATTRILHLNYVYNVIIHATLVIMGLHACHVCLLLYVCCQLLIYVYVHLLGTLISHSNLRAYLVILRAIHAHRLPPTAQTAIQPPPTVL